EADEDRLRELRESGTPIVVVDADLLPEAHHTTAAGPLDTVRGIVAPDAAVDHEAVGVVHRRLGGAELYFLAHTGAEPCEAELRPRTASASWESWDAHDGAVAPARGPSRLALAPSEGRIVVTSPQAGPAPAPP